MSRGIARSVSPYEERYGFSRGVRIGNRVEIAGTAPVPLEGDPVAVTAYDQMLRCGEIVVAALVEPEWRVEIEVEAAIGERR